MNTPQQLKYSKSHEWVKFTGEGGAQVGLTDYAQDSLGSVVYISLPEEGRQVQAEEQIGEVESVKAVSEIFSPLAGRISAVNASLEDEPEAINADPYATWLIELEGVEEGEGLLSADEYEAFVGEG